MGKVFLGFIVLIILAIIWSLPLFLSVNLFCLVFNIPFRLSILQAFVLCALASTIHRLLFGNKEDK